MKHSVVQDNLGTHIDWSHDGITASMIDWFWSNMEKCFLLWHPSEHEPLTWALEPNKDRFLGAVHLAPQTLELPSPPTPLPTSGEGSLTL